MRERTDLISAIRSEILGPEVAGAATRILSGTGEILDATGTDGSGPLFWRPDPESPPQEIVHFYGERPGRKYGVGRVWPQSMVRDRNVGDKPLEDRSGYEVERQSATEWEAPVDPAGTANLMEAGEGLDPALGTSGDEDFDIPSADVLHPSSMAISLCATLSEEGTLVVRLPRNRRFPWQQPGDAPFDVNGRYVPRKLSGLGSESVTGWCREPAVPTDATVSFAETDLRKGRRLEMPIPLAASSPLKLNILCFPRVQKNGTLVVTVVLRNVSPAVSGEDAESMSLFQACFEVTVEGGAIAPYPESPMPFERLDADEQSLALLYRDDRTWAIGHGCAAGWELTPHGSAAHVVWVDPLPAVELPSMTPDIVLADGRSLRLSMRELSELPEDFSGPGWTSLRLLVDAYASWLAGQRMSASAERDDRLRTVATRHLDSCEAVHARMSSGLELLKTDRQVRAAFCLANTAMLLQQLAGKYLTTRPLSIPKRGMPPTPNGDHVSPLEIWRTKTEPDRIGHWRAFQAGFLLLSLEGATDPSSVDRDIVDLIWFPTGGGKTEAYLGVMAVHMFHQRLIMAEEAQGSLPRDGTNVLMRYTLRMLTTQQFQRAASLICAMEMIRRSGNELGFDAITGGRFSLGLWLGGDGSPNNIESARASVRAYARDHGKGGNPLVLTECPWCRSAIGAIASPGGRHAVSLAGISTIGDNGPLLHCSDSRCAFGGPPTRWKEWLPVEVIDERIYSNPPSLVIATADKFAMMAYRPDAGAIFGRGTGGQSGSPVAQPPGLIIQDELHLIAGPLGTIYGMYEAVIEDLCTVEQPDRALRVKRIASTATIRGSDFQVRSIFGRGPTGMTQPRLQLFPSPGLTMEDSFFGRYARDNTDRLKSGRLYLGVHGNEYGSVLTTQVRVFSRVLLAVQAMPENKRDPWWTLLSFYNSLRELGGAHTLVQSDIRSRLAFLARRMGVIAADRRTISTPQELTSRRSQAEIVQMLDALAVAYDARRNRAIDICLASNIIEVGVDIDRLSLMAVVGQPKTTAQYIQVTGRVGRRWDERPGLVLTLYNPMRSRDRSHYEQFHSYHNRLYERVEPTTATPFSRSAIERAAAGAALLWTRQQVKRGPPDVESHGPVIRRAFELLAARCRDVESAQSLDASLSQLAATRDDLLRKLKANPAEWEQFPPQANVDYLMLWPGQAYDHHQRYNGVVIPSSMRQVDGSAELEVTLRYTQGVTTMGDAT